MLSLAATVAQAGTMTTTLDVSARYSDTTLTTPLPLLKTLGRVDNGQPGIYGVDVYFTAVKAAGEKGWLNTLFNAAAANNQLGSNLALVTSDPNAPYSPNGGTLDINGAAAGGITAIYGTNTDGGAPGDLQSILASLASSTLSTTANDTRNNLGTAGAPANAGNPSYIGTFFVSWNGLGTGDVQLLGQQYAFSLENNTPTIFTDDTAGPTTNVPGIAASGGFGLAIPEPATVTLFGLAMLGGLGVIRRRS